MKLGRLFIELISGLLKSEDEIIDSDPMDYPTIDHVQRKKSQEYSGVYKGEFRVAGYDTLSDKVKIYIWTHLEDGDVVKLRVQKIDDYGKNSISVYSKDEFIGWVDKMYSRKKMLFTALEEGTKITTHCVDKWKGQRRIKKKVESNEYDFLNMKRGIVIKYSVDFS